MSGQRARRHTFRRGVAGVIALVATFLVGSTSGADAIARSGRMTIDIAKSHALDGRHMSRAEVESMLTHSAIASSSFGRALTNAANNLETTAAVTAAAAAYTPAAAVSYADKYSCNETWYGRCRNSAYKSISNDCTNFVSQALHAGGMPYFFGADQWFPYTWDWVNVAGLWAFLMWDKNASWVEYSGSSLLSQHYTTAGLGDLFVYDWGKGLGMSHVSIEAGWGARSSHYTADGQGDFVDQHSIDRYHSPWNYGYLHPDSSIDRSKMHVYVVHIQH